MADRPLSRIERIMHTASLAPSGDWAEFGVFGGESAKALIKTMPDGTTIHLFDSFKGLPHDGPNKYWSKGRFNAPVFKTDAANVKVIPGWFNKTLPGYFTPNSLAFAHIDCDLYESTKDVLENISEALVPGALILFDEMFAWPYWEEGEYKALMEWTAREYEWVYRNEKAQQASIRVL